MVNGNRISNSIGWNLLKPKGESQSFTLSLSRCKDSDFTVEQNRKTLLFTDSLRPTVQVRKALSEAFSGHIVFKLLEYS